LWGAKKKTGAIESGNYKGALALCTKQLSKHPDSLLTKALKGLTLEQMGKVDEGLAVCKEVADKRPTDVAVLQALGFAYNSQHKCKDPHNGLVQRLNPMHQTTCCCKRTKTRSSRTRHRNRSVTTSTWLPCATMPT